MTKETAPASKRRLNSDEWLARALEALAKEGSDVLTIETLSKRLGVRRGSFYWHFKDRGDFVRQLVEYWSVVYTQGVVNHSRRVEGSASERLLALMEQIVSNRLNRYDIPIRAWASHDAMAARMVRKVDNIRLDYVRSLFAEIGFEDEDLEIRTRTFVVYHSMEPGLFAKTPRKEQLKQIKRRHAFFTRR